MGFNSGFKGLITHTVLGVFSVHSCKVETVRVRNAGIFFQCEVMS